MSFTEFKTRGGSRIALAPGRIEGIETIDLDHVRIWYKRPDRGYVEVEASFLQVAEELPDGFVEFEQVTKGTRVAILPRKVTGFEEGIRKNVTTIYYPVPGGRTIKVAATFNEVKRTLTAKKG